MKRLIHLIGHVIWGLSSAAKFVHHRLADGLLVRQKSRQDVPQSVRKHVHPLGLVSEPVALANRAGEPRCQDVVLATRANYDTWTTNSRGHDMRIPATRQAWQTVSASDSLHDSVLWLPDEEWMELKEIRGGQLRGMVNELRLRWVTPQ